jgi:hypothetical protein
MAETSTNGGPEKAEPRRRLARKRIAKGPPRPQYFESRDQDRMMIMFVALMAEVMAIRDRLDTDETLLERTGTLSAEAIEAFRPDDVKEEAREAARLAMMRRVFRVLREEFEGGKA